MSGCAFFPGQEAGHQGNGSFIALLWNVQALFDGQEHGSEYVEFRETSGWTQEKYQARITAISQAILQMAPPEGSMAVISGKPSKAIAPDLIGFVEIENIGVLQDLAEALSRHGYNWTAFSIAPGSSSGLGVLSRFPITDLRTHSITRGKLSAPRPVLELRVEPNGEPIVFLLCHWKSKLGSDTETQRRDSARIVQRRLRELNESGIPLVVMGDLNENHDEFYRYKGSIPGIYSLLPDDSDAALLEEKTPGDFLVLSGEKPPLSVNFKDVPALYSPWVAEMDGGSYYYRGDWETIDHFLLSEWLFSGSLWNYSRCYVLNHEPFVSSKGIPNAYVPRYGGGLSDHLPLLLFLKFL